MLADSHIHLFKNGYKDSGEDEVSHYESLIKKYSIDCALVVGYEGEQWALGNNAYISSLAVTRPWLYPLAFIRPEELQISELETFLSMGFEGITLYLFSDSDEANLLGVDRVVWQWLVDHHWVISVNSKGDRWNTWLDILRRFPKLTLLISHLGLPTVDVRNLSLADIDVQIAPMRGIYQYQNVYLKLSGFYALEPTSPIYPYPTLDPYLKYIFDNFPIDRLIWGSDFTLALATVEFPQTFQHLSELPFLTPPKRSKILHQNLLDLLSRNTKSKVR